MDPNARVCSVHFTKDDFIKPVLQDFKPLKATLKRHAIPSVFSHCPLPKQRRFSEMRAARRDRKDFIDSLFSDSSNSEPYLSDASLSSNTSSVLNPPQQSSNTSSVLDPPQQSSYVPRTIDIGVQCGKF